MRVMNQLTLCGARLRFAKEELAKIQTLCDKGGVG
jgi:hypothetical protein